jgi:predicted dinucleotide-binding enzyme
VTFEPDAPTRRHTHLLGLIVTAASGRAQRLVYLGDHQGRQSVAATLIRDVGFEPVGAGPLRIPRYMEPFALLVGQLADEGDGGPGLAYRFERFANAEKRNPRSASV